MSDLSAQSVGDSIEISAREGAKVNVRSEPDVSVQNVVGKAVGGDLAVVLATSQQGSFTWYQVRSDLGGFEGWIRGDLIRLSETVQQPVNRESVATMDDVSKAGEPEGNDAVTEKKPAESAPIRRTGWTTLVPGYVDAALSCVETGSAQPAVAVDMDTLQRGLIEVDILDAAARQWKCVIRENGGTPLRFDPMFNGRSLDLRDGPYFASAETGRPDGEDCDTVEPISSSSGRNGWVVYTDCP